MSIVIVNAGSSSVKLTCYGQHSDLGMATGMVERIGLQGTLLHYQSAEKIPIKKQVDIRNTSKAVALLARCLIDPERGCLHSLEEVRAVGHRVVHGSEKLNQPTVVDAAVKLS
ncbi:MAG TPA: hypothetical protein HPP90_12360 [Deltaproteobacteria bacterium]|nr:hypothetical protein [Deltaproteobacteria bacterium]